MSTKLRELREKRDALVEKQAKEYDELSKLDHGADGHTQRRDSVKALTAEIGDLSDTIDVMAKMEELRKADSVKDAKREEAERAGRSTDPWGDVSDPTANALPNFAKIARGMLAKAIGGDPSASTGMMVKNLPGDGRAFKATHTTTAANAAGQVPDVALTIPGFFEFAREEPEVIDVVPTAETSQSAVAYIEETDYDNNAEERNENAEYVESNYKRARKSSPVRVIGHRVEVTDELLEDIPAFETYVNSRLVVGVRERLSGQIIKGNGTPPNLAGIVGHAAHGILTLAQPAAGSSTALAIHMGLAKIRAEGFRRPTHVFIHPTDWDRVRTQDYSGIFPFGPPTAAGVERLWGLRVVQTTDLTVKTALVGTMNLDSIGLFVRRGIQIVAGYNADDLAMGRITIRAGGRYALPLIRPKSFCTVTALK